MGSAEITGAKVGIPLSDASMGLATGTSSGRNGGRSEDTDIPIGEGERG